MAKAKSTEDLWAELRGLLKLAGRVTRRKPVRGASKSRATTSGAGSTRRAAAIRRGLAGGDLGRVRAQIPDEDSGNKSQQAVVYAYACMLETHSAGLSIVFDRFPARERQKIARALKAIGAAQTLRALRRLELALAREFAHKRSRIEAAARLGELPAARRIDTQSRSHAAEIEKKLLAFCKAHVEELAGVQR